MDKDPKFTFKHLFKRLSTWASILSTSAIGTLGWYFSQPAEVQATIPSSLIALCSWVAFIGTALVPIATSYRQKSLKG